jgi:Type I phosphodiesterase / nucleotide pyrophosphatase
VDGSAVSSAWLAASCDLPRAHLERIRRGTYPGRSPDVVLVPKAPNYFGNYTLTTHSGPWAYLQRVPLVLFGPGFVRPGGRVDAGRAPTVADLAPTTAELIGTPWPAGRRGRILHEALVPARRRPGRPRLVVTIVWDGGGDNVLERWPGAWPELRRLMRGGTWYAGATVGSSPSVTPAVHATIGTGVFPDVHGIVDIPVRTGDGIQDAYAGNSPRLLEVGTLADIHDRATGNRAKVALLAERNWHLGMLGHGSLATGGDKDIAVLFDQAGRPLTNPDAYSLPRYIRDAPGLGGYVRPLDAGDGRIDGGWKGHDLADGESRVRSPAFTLYQSDLLELLLRRGDLGEDQVADLLFTNFKQIDLLGHVYNMVNPEVRAALRYSDAALGRLVGELNRVVGRRRWVIALTADHGQTPTGRVSGGWPISIEELAIDIAAAFDVEREELLVGERPVGLWLAPAARRLGIAPEDVADFVARYRLADNLKPGERVAPGHSRNELLFSASFPTSRLARVSRCVRNR